MAAGTYVKLLVTCCTFLVVIDVCYAQVTFRDPTQAALIGKLAAYEVAVPHKVSSQGHFVSHQLSHGYSISPESRRRRRRRAVEASGDDPDEVHYRVKVGGVERHLHLTPNWNLLSPGMVVERRAKNQSFPLRRPSEFQCHYFGTVKGHRESSVAVSTCDGLTGYVRLGREEYLIEPVKGHNKTLDGQHPHLVYKRSAVSELSSSDSSASQHSTCGNDDAVERAFQQREEWQKSQGNYFTGSAANETGRRRRRSVSVERYVETLVVADHKMNEYYSEEDIETYILTVMNMVSSLYRDESIGNAINIVLVRLMLLGDESAEEGLDISHHADNTLRSFCKWQAGINPSDDDHPNHHDVAILLTRYNICTRMNEPCSTLGLAEVAGMCQLHRSCSVNEDTGLSLSYTIAHELGHNFGANHDGPSNGCESHMGERQHVMSPQLSSEAGPFVWSNCSRKEITKFLDRNWGACLEDAPSDHKFRYPELPPGAMYNADHQCRLQYGHDASHCAGMDDLCQTLWCKLPDNRCVTRLEPPAPGTVCGKHKWCHLGQCVPIRERPQPIDGEWGSWTSWSECSRTCGAGISSSGRSCDNPAPAHGGKYCTGERRRYRVCNLENCPEGNPSFRAVQCSAFNSVPYKGENYTWLPVHIRNSPCQLHCKPENESYSVTLADTVTDGTPCNPGTRDMCINGVCRRVACDWGIESQAQEDRCGVCHGDGTQCNTIRGNYTLSEAIDYVEMLVVPKGARNIKVEEVEEARNYIAVQSEATKEFYLNGQWLVQWTGEYRAAGTLMHYTRDGELDEVFIPGPIQENVVFLLLFRATNPGVRYEYTVPNENITRIPEFRWEYMDWSVCTVTCGGGSQVSKPKCMEKEAGLVEETHCAHLPKPPEKSRVCNKQSCPARWWVGPWQHCSVSCGNSGFRRRTVICVRPISDDEQIALMDSDCQVSDKPEEEGSCAEMPACPGDVTWEAGPWSKCSLDPCDVQQREVRCSVPGGPCAEALKPATEKQCGSILCGNWSFGNWSECSSSCGEGVQFRRVSCEGGMKCRDVTEPESIRKCRGLCDGVTYSSEAETPSETTSNHSSAPAVPIKNSEDRPTGYVEDKIEVNNLKVVEMQQVTVLPSVDVDDNEIQLSDEPVKTARKMAVHIGEDAVVFLNKITSVSHGGENRIDVSKIKPKFQWKIGQWSKCSVRCDGGTQVRDVSCYEVTTWTLVDDALCDQDKPEDVQECNEIPCLDWALSPWSGCSVTCGPGTKSREVRCPQEDMCNPDTMPMETAPCNDRPCIDWLPGPWSSCSATCGGGEQRRAVQCMDRRNSTPASGCAQQEKPRQRQRCATEPCPGKESKHHGQNEVKERLRSCHDKLDAKLCGTLKHMCGTWYFKVKCCRTCRKFANHN